MTKLMLMTAGIVLALAVPARAAREAAAPGGTVAVNLGSETATVWPYTSDDFAKPSDPINLFFLGTADPRIVRQVLLGLDGDRTGMGLPPAPPFNCRWEDAIGRHQVAWSTAEGWQGSAVELQCGSYNGARVHVRLFRQGAITIGNAHFEAMIPGTADHEVLSWEFAQALVQYDLFRSGAIVGPQTAPISQYPYFREIRWQVLNGVPAGLRQLLGLPTTQQSANVPLANDGRASVFTLSAEFQPAQEQRVVEFDHPFGQAVPKPFCAIGPLDWLYVTGTLHMIHTVHTNPSGRYQAGFSANGVLTVVPIDPQTGLATGAPLQAVVSETHRSQITDERAQVKHLMSQTLLGNPAQAFYESLDAGHKDAFLRELFCGQ